jgi:hypothetical protein
MAISTTSPIYGGTSGVSNKHLGVAIQKFEYDLSTFTGASADQAYLIAIPAKTILLGLQAELVTATTGVTRFDLGDTSSATLFVSNHATFTAGSVMTQAVTTNPLKYYATADKLLLKITGVPATGTLRFLTLMVDATRDAPMTTQS